MNSPWISSDPESVPLTISTDGYASLVDLLEQACKRYGPRAAVQSFGAQLTYAKLEQEAACFARWLQSLGLDPGARVALMLPNVDSPTPMIGASGDSIRAISMLGNRLDRIAADIHPELPPPTMMICFMGFFIPLIF